MNKALAGNKKTQPRRKKKMVDMKMYAGKVKAFRDVNALYYQKKIREE